MNYILTVNEEQAEVMCKSLDLFARIGCGQFEEVLKHPIIEKRVLHGKIVQRHTIMARRYLDLTKQLLLDLASGVSTGITTADEPSRVAYDILQVVQQPIAMKNDVPHSVRRQDPLKCSDQPLPKIVEE